jgi:hypothetical protein
MTFPFLFSPSLSSAKAGGGDGIPLFSHFLSFSLAFKKREMEESL